MSVPKSVTKIKTKQGKSEVILLSNVERCNYTIDELTKAALRDVGKVLKKYIAEATPVKTGLLKSSWQTWVRKDRANGEQQLLLGVYSGAQARKKGQPYAHHAHLVILGHNTADGKWIPPNTFFEDTVRNNLDLIRDVEGQYLSAIEDEQKAVSIAEAEETKQEDD